MANLLNIIITASEKAAKIARACRENQNLFNLLVEEKENEVLNARFFKDFKTLADVLIQETVRHDIENYFPVLAEHIFGEESNIFTNTLGETIEVKVCSHENDTAKLLETVLNGNTDTAKILATEVHRIIHINAVNIDNSALPSNVDIDIEKLGLWIDPIDCTAEYINAKETKDESGIFLSGLQCVTVLIGVYDKTTGIPLLGVINQPFHHQNNSEWAGKCYWGIHISNLQLSSLEISNKETKVIALSRIEKDTTVKNKLIESGYRLVAASGAGYKLLSVITGVADVYIVSQGTTYRWDVCGPHAILRSLGGGIFDYSKALAGEIVEIEYIDVEGQNELSKMKRYSNKNGLIAVKNKDVIENLVHLLRK